MYDKRDSFDFDINIFFPSLDCNVPCSTSYGIYSSHFIRLARVARHVDDLTLFYGLLCGHIQALTVKLNENRYK